MAQVFERNTLVVARPFFHMKGVLASLKTEKLLKTECNLLKMQPPVWPRKVAEQSA